MKLGGHCVLFGPAIRQDTAGVLGKLAYAGAEGCEMGERFFGLDGREELLDALDARHIELSGLHCNGLTLPDLLHAPDKAREALRKTASFVAPMKNKNVIASGSTGDAPEVTRGRILSQGALSDELHDGENARMIARNLNDIVREIKNDFGVQVHYHNHSWEFADGGRIWFALAEHAPDVKFALDTGWAAVSGYDPVELLKSVKGRISYVHLRDFVRKKGPESLRFQEAHEGFVDLGEGDMGYPRLMRQLHETLGADGWAIVEYEIGNFDENSYLKAISYLKGVRDML